MMKEKIEELLVKVLGEGAEIVHEMLGGMMNISYLVKDKNDKKYIIYIPTEQANEMVDRHKEKEHQRIIEEWNKSAEKESEKIIERKKNCPFCGEKIGIDETQCKFCGENLEKNTEV